MRMPARVRALGWRTGKRAVDWSARQLKLASYVPAYDYREQLDLKTTLTRDDRADPRQARVDGLGRGRRPHAHARGPRRRRGREGLDRAPDARGGAEVRDPHALDRRASRALVPRVLGLRGGQASPRALGGGAPGAARLGVRRPAPGRQLARARAVRPRLLPRRALPQRVPPRAARDAESRDAAGGRDASRDDDRPASRLRGPRPLATGNRQSEDGSHLRRAPDRARLDGLARRHRVHRLPAGVERGAPRSAGRPTSSVPMPISPTSSDPNAAPSAPRELARRGSADPRRDRRRRRQHLGCARPADRACPPSSETS